MNADRFWAIVEEARNEVDGWPEDVNRQWADALYANLVILPPEDIFDFDRRFRAIRRLAETPEMAAATQLVVRSFPGDEADLTYRVFPLKFRAFVNCLVMLGRDTFERTVADPDALADHPLIRTVADGQLPGSVLLAGRVDHAVGDAFYERTLGDDGIIDRLSQSTTDDGGAGDDRPDGEDGEDDQDEDDDEDENGSGAAWLAERLPRLLDIFAPGR